MRAFEIERQVHLASGVLPAAGAYTAQNYIDLPPGAKIIVFWITYTRGGALGQPKFRLQWGNGTETDADELTQYDPGAEVVDDVVNTPYYLERPLGPPPVDGTARVYRLPVEIIDMGARQLRMLVAEHGNVGAPGTIAIAYTGTRGGPL